MDHSDEIAPSLNVEALIDPTTDDRETWRKLSLDEQLFVLQREIDVLEELGVFDSIWNEAEQIRNSCPEKPAVVRISTGVRFLPIDNIHKR